MRTSLASGAISHRPCLGFAKERREARAAVEARQAEPVDRAVASNEREGLAIADDGVILDTAWHQGSDKNGVERDNVSFCEGFLGWRRCLPPPRRTPALPFETIAASIANRPESARPPRAFYCRLTMRHRRGRASRQRIREVPNGTLCNPPRPVADIAACGAALEPDGRRGQSAQSGSDHHQIAGRVAVGNAALVSSRAAPTRVL